MKKNHLIPCLTLLLSGSLMAQTVATVNGDKIDSSTVEAVVKNLRRQNQQLPDSPELRNEVTRRLAISAAVAQEAKKLKLDQSAQYKQAVEKARAAAKKEGADKQPSFKQDWALYETDLLNQAYFANVVRQNPVSDTETKQAYDRLNSHYQGSQEVQLGEIITRNGSDAQKALGELKSKKSFKEVAAKYSADPRAKQSGGIGAGYIPLKDLQQANPPVYQAVGSLKKGAYTASPLQDNNGNFAIFYVNDKRNIQVPPFDQIKNRIANDLQQERIARAVDGVVQKADIRPAR